MTILAGQVAASAMVENRFAISILGKLKTLDCSLTLLRNVANDVSDGIRLILEVTVSHVGEAILREPLAVASGLQEALLVSRGHGRIILLRGLDKAVGNLFLDASRVGEGLDKVLHVVALSTNQAAQVKDDTASLVALAQDGHVGVLESSKLLLVPLAITLQLFGNLLLEDKSLEGVIALLLGTSKTDGHARRIILLLVNNGGKTTVLSLVALNLDLEVLGLLGELLRKGLEFQELKDMLAPRISHRGNGNLVRTCCFQLSSSSLR